MSSRSEADAAAGMAPACQFINGTFTPGSGGDSIDVVNPATGETITAVAAGTAEDVNSAVAAARAAQPAWGAMTPREHSEILHQVADRLEANALDLARLESLNTGKPPAVAEDDVSSAVDTFRFMAGAGRTMTSLAAADYAAGHTSVILREPLGVVGVITPWNYPLLMAAWKLAPILAAGNTVVLKPSEQTPLTTLKLAELITDIVPAGVVNIVTGYGDPVGSRLSAHPDVALVALTGSVGSGSAVAAAAAPRASGCIWSSEAKLRSWSSPMQT
ncbi:aldehyde dehydrogenase family protein [Arthrobacter sp. OVS8]|nr:aldehyde dehydrogenase family protein [Arthrobacter sp. OVS8]